MKKKIETIIKITQMKTKLQKKKTKISQKEQTKNEIIIKTQIIYPNKDIKHEDKLCGANCGNKTFFILNQEFYYEEYIFHNGSIGNLTWGGSAILQSFTT